MPRKPLQLSDRCDPVSPTVPALQLELHHPAPRSLLCMDASFCVLRCRVLRRAKSPGASIMEQDAPRLQPPLTLLCHPGRRFSAGERWRLRVGMGGDLVAIGTTPPTLLSLPFPCISCLAVRCVRYRVPPGPTHAALGMRACCVRRSSCGQGGLRGMLTA